MEDHIPAGAKFYVKFVIGNADGTIDPGLEAIEGSEDIEMVLAATVDDIEAYGGEAYVYECRAVRRVFQGRARVQTVKPK